MLYAYLSWILVPNVQISILVYLMASSYLALLIGNRQPVLNGPKAILPRSPKVFRWDAGIMEPETFVVVVGQCRDARAGPMNNRMVGEINF